MCMYGVFVCGCVLCAACVPYMYHISGVSAIHICAVYVVVLFVCVLSVCSIYARVSCLVC